MIKIESIHETASDDNAFRVFIEPAWPRRVSREKTVLNVWMRDLAPSAKLFDLYSLGVLGWEDFTARYHGELERNRDFFADLKDHDRNGGLTLVHASRDKEHNAAVALMMLLERGTPATARKDTG